jgi:hypothetical protein
LELLSFFNITELFYKEYEDYIFNRFIKLKVSYVIKCEFHEDLLKNLLKNYENKEFDDYLVKINYDNNELKRSILNLIEINKKILLELNEFENNLRISVLINKDRKKLQTKFDILLLNLNNINLEFGKNLNTIKYIN